MALNRPSLQELKRRIESDMLSRVTIGLGILRRSFIKVLSVVFALAINLTYGFIDINVLGAFVTTATGLYLDALGLVWGIIRKRAFKATGSITPVGTALTVIPVLTIFKNASGIEYQTQAALTLPGSVAIKAVTGGADGNLDAGEVLTIDTPISGVESEAPVDTGGLSGGADIESDDVYRVRILNRIQFAPNGGKPGDYENWVKNYAGSFSVFKAWEFPLQEGPATVKVYFTLYDDAQAVPFVNPNTAQLTEIQTEIDKKAPTIALPDVAAPTQAPVEIVMDLTPNNATVQAAVRASLREYFKNNSKIAMTLLKSQLDEAISLAAGETDHLITDMEVFANPVTVGNINFGVGQLPTIQDSGITFNP